MPRSHPPVPRPRRGLRQVLYLVGILGLTVPLRAEWPMFRGPDQGRAPRGDRPPLRWGEDQNIAWKTPVPADGWSSPVLADGHLWLTGASPDGRLLQVLSFDARTGTPGTRVTVFQLEAAGAKHAANSHASPTPAVHAGRVFASFGTHGIAAVDAKSGAILWTNRELRIDHDSNGAGSSPVVLGERVFLNCDGTDARYVAALDAASGRILWRSPRPNPIDKAAYFHKAHSTPVLRQSGGGTELVTVGSFHVSALDPADGHERWGVELPGFCAVPVPVVGDGGRVFVCTGFEKAQLWAIDPDNAAPRVVWRQRRQIPLVSTPVLDRDHLFLVSDGGIASCLDAADGSVAWSERIGGSHWASPLAANGFVYFFDAEGTTTVVAADPDFRVVSVNTLPEGVKASPAVDGSALFLRTTGHLYRLENRP